MNHSTFLRESECKLLYKTQIFRGHFWAAEPTNPCELHARVQGKPAQYTLVFKAKGENLSVDEELLVSNVKVISVQDGKGEVKDEDGEKITEYKSNKLALRSAGDYGHKPVTSALTEFIQGWEFYDLQPGYMRTNADRSASGTKDTRESLKLNRYGVNVPDILWDWHQNTREDFDYVNDSLVASTNINIDTAKLMGNSQLCLLEGYKEPIPLINASDGTLRLLAYHTLLGLPELPPLIAIEEPERSLHPGALTDIASILEQLSKRTQVIITTHSSQLLDAFSSDSLSDTLGVLFLRNRPGLGTEVIDIEDKRGDDEALSGWIKDFGIGSAIFHSELLQDMVENESACHE